MPKRKRPNETLEGKLPQFKTDLFRALKKVKGFERQRLSRRLHEKGLPEDRKEKYELEVAVLKSLDLHQTAFHYLYTSLLKIKSISNHPDLPKEVRQEFPNPDLEEKEKAALHHVTSCLFNRLEVRQVMDRIINETCETLDVPPPEKKKPKKKGAKEKEDDHEKKLEEKAIDTEAEKEAPQAQTRELSDRKAEKRKKAEKDKKRLLDDKSVSGDDGEGSDDEAEERTFSKYDRLLGGSSESDADSESESDGGVTIQKGKYKTRSIRIRDMSISLSPESSDVSEPEVEPDLESEPESSSEFAGFSDSEADLGTTRLSKVEKPSEITSKKTKEKPAKAARSTGAAPARPTDSTFLPSLMGGYISGSESASDVDVAPRKNRLGQKQRQAIWEKKYGAKAKHLAEPQKPQKKGNSRRDDGWDLRRGAVGGEDAGQRKPWKKGIDNPLAAMSRGSGTQKQARARPVTKKDDEGPLHPSWEARKKAKQQAQKIVIQPSAANKIVFD
ncbi:hypothetical protein jhhlp_008422 [Lomentospora prolificans]|uniref:Bud22 domain-containing protein n=1 Tax=Lomentospora prolificans TaxID=41688 RepID=A0A2N3MY06_9PEZI|nr:hypothetical protein jhhlp_008422 [Lomentospora prolificans]